MKKKTKQTPQGNTGPPFSPLSFQMEVNLSQLRNALCNFLFFGKGVIGKQPTSRDVVSQGPSKEKHVGLIRTEKEIEKKYSEQLEGKTLGW